MGEGCTLVPNKICGFFSFNIFLTSSIKISKEQSFLGFLSLVTLINGKNQLPMTHNFFKHISTNLTNKYFFLKNKTEGWFVVRSLEKYFDYIDFF